MLFQRFERIDKWDVLVQTGAPLVDFGGKVDKQQWKMQAVFIKNLLSTNSTVCFQALICTLTMLLQIGPRRCWRKSNNSLTAPQINESYQGNETDWREELIILELFNLISVVD